MPTNVCFCAHLLGVVSRDGFARYFDTKVVVTINLFLPSNRSSAGKALLLDAQRNLYLEELNVEWYLLTHAMLDGVDVQLGPSNQSKTHIGYEFREGNLTRNSR